MYLNRFIKFLREWSFSFYLGSFYCFKYWVDNLFEWMRHSFILYNVVSRMSSLVLNLCFQIRDVVNMDWKQNLVLLECDMERKLKRSNCTLQKNESTDSRKIKHIFHTSTNTYTIKNVIEKKEVMNKDVNWELLALAKFLDNIPGQFEKIYYHCLFLTQQQGSTLEG